MRRILDRIAHIVLPIVGIVAVLALVASAAGWGAELPTVGPAFDLSAAAADPAVGHALAQQGAAQTAQALAIPWWAKAGGLLLTLVLGVAEFTKAAPIARLAKRLPMVRRWLSAGEDYRQKANAGAAAIVSVDLARDMIRTLDRRLADELDPEKRALLAKVLEQLSGGKAATIEDLLVHGLASAQTDQGQRVAVKALRDEIRDRAFTHRGILQPGHIGMVAELFPKEAA